MPPPLQQSPSALGCLTCTPEPSGQGLDPSAPPMLRPAVSPANCRGPSPLDHSRATEWAVSPSQDPLPVPRAWAGGWSILTCGVPAPSLFS